MSAPVATSSVIAFDYSSAGLGAGFVVAALVLVAGIGLWLRNRREHKPGKYPWSMHDEREAHVQPDLPVAKPSGAAAASRIPEAERAKHRPAEPPARSQPVAAAPAGERRSSPAMAAVAAVPQTLGGEARVVFTDHPGLGREGERLRAVEQRVGLQDDELAQVREQLRRITQRLDELTRSAQLERTVVDPRAVLPPAFASSAPTTRPEIFEDRLLDLWNHLNWEQGKPPLSPIEHLLREQSYDFVDGIVGTYALAVPRRFDDDADAPVYILPFLGKANAHYDDSLFDRPPAGDSERVSAVARVRFVEHGGSREVLLERLRGGNAKLSQVFKVVARGRIE